MKRLLAILASLAFAGNALCQTPLTPEQVIQRMIESGSIEGAQQRIIGRMGDAAAVAVTKVVGGKNLNEGETDSVLVILTKSFADPNAVQIVPDREPRTTLFVLHWLESVTRNPKLKLRIVQTRKYVVEQAHKAKNQ